jgi:hypothetical protein
MVSGLGFARRRPPTRRAYQGLGIAEESRSPGLGITLDHTKVSNAKELSAALLFCHQKIIPVEDFMLIKRVSQPVEIEKSALVYLGSVE